jgi:GrpB-like predicted nucleotidyltransferase (UPF0157 family)
MKKTTAGLQRGTVQVVAYRPEWHALFLEEKQRLQTALGSKVYDIEHIGSTAVPGLAAKPLIDMIAAVDDLSVYKELIAPLTTLGYEFMPERVFADRIFFPKGPRENRTHHLSLVVKNSAGWRDPIVFRDYLAEHSETRDAYQKLKQNLAIKYANDRRAYTAAKSAFIQKALRSIKE